MIAIIVSCFVPFSEAFSWAQLFRGAAAKSDNDKAGGVVLASQKADRKIADFKAPIKYNPLQGKLIIKIG